VAAIRVCRSAFVFVSLSVSIALAGSARAQYLFLDSNGDAVHTAADVVASSGATSIDVWLVTNANRDGSPAACVTGDGDLTVNAYEFVLRTSNGTVSWGAAVNQITAFSTPYGNAALGADIHVGWVGGTPLPPGAYRLATVPVTVTAGTPDIQIVGSTLIGPNYGTSFGSLCSGSDFDNTMKLGREWNDTDGLAWGGVANSAPILTQPSDMSVTEGETADQPLSASDPDGDALTFSGSSPAFMTVTTTSPTGGNVHLAPGATNAGSYVAEIRATDGFVTSTKSFHVTVLEGVSIEVGPVADMTAASYGLSTQNVAGTSLDRRALHFLTGDGPQFVNVVDRQNGTAEIRVEPGIQDAGTFRASLIVRDNVSPDVVREFQVVVDPPPPCEPGYCYLEREWSPTDYDYTVDLHLADVNGDSKLDLVTIGSVTMFVRLGRGNGTFDAPLTIAIPISANTYYASSTVGDLNSDGRSDLLVLLYERSYLSAHLVPFFGNPDGSLSPGTEIRNEQFRGRPAIADFNNDGIADVAIRSDVVGTEVFLGAGAGTYSAPLVISTPLYTSGLATGDFNRDGNADMAVIGSSTIYMFPGNGDGTFGAARTSVFSSQWSIVNMIVSDYDGDGISDIATLIGSGAPGLAQVCHGVGDGSFTTGPLVRFWGQAEELFAGDLDGDGKADLIAAGWDPEGARLGELAVIPGRSDGFAPALDYPRPGVFLIAATGDANGDGRDDIALTNIYDVQMLMSRGITPVAKRPPRLSGIPDELERGNQTNRDIYFTARLYDPDDPPIQILMDQSELPIPFLYFNYQGVNAYYNVNGLVPPLTPPGTYTIRFTGVAGGDSVRQNLVLNITGDVPETFQSEILQDNDSRSLALVGHDAKRYCLGIEPMDSRFDASEVRLTSVVMKSDLGSASSIHALTDKPSVVIDSDGDGIQEAEVCFSKDDMAKLFSTVKGRREVTATVEAFLFSGRKISGPVTLTVIGGKGSSTTAADVWPNPLNPRGILAFEMGRDGAARVELFDVRGRRIATLLDQPALVAGRHEIPINGTDSRGGRLGSGIYYYWVTTPDGQVNGRLAILK
jgi:hypothetical protein